MMLFHTHRYIIRTSIDLTSRKNGFNKVFQHLLGSVRSKSFYQRISFSIVYATNKFKSDFISLLYAYSNCAFTFVMKSLIVQQMNLVFRGLYNNDVCFQYELILKLVIHDCTNCKLSSSNQIHFFVDGRLQTRLLLTIEFGMVAEQ